MLPDWSVELLDATDFPEETGASFLANALAKARFGRERVAAAAWVAGEDSGLEVEALGGAPGIHSARYAGPEASDEANVEKLLRELDGVVERDRAARYVCELVALGPAGEEVRGRGTLAGRIAEMPRGTGGFGYDPVFIPDGETRTVAELGDEWKARRSHRAQAARTLAARLGRTESPV